MPKRKPPKPLPKHPWLEGERPDAFTKEDPTAKHLPKIGRPRIPIDIEDIERLASIQCTDEEIAAFCRCHVDTIRRRMKEDPEFCRAMTMGPSIGKISLRRTQFRIAEGGSADMAKHLGKNYLAQKDKIEQHNTGVIRTEYVQIVLPSNGRGDPDDIAGE